MRRVGMDPYYSLSKNVFLMVEANKPEVISKVIPTSFPLCDFSFLQVSLIQILKTHYLVN